jgi:hypothetical protein
VRGRNEDRRLRGSRHPKRPVLYGSKCCRATKTRRKRAPLKQKVNRRQVAYIILCCVSGPPLYTKVYLAFRSFPSHCCITLTRYRSYPYARRSIRLLGLPPPECHLKSTIESLSRNRWVSVKSTTLNPGGLHRRRRRTDATQISRCNPYYPGWYGILTSS